MAPPADRRYSRSHVWASPGDGGEARVGLTHVPGGFLGDAVYVELPAAGTEVVSGEPIGLVESSSAVCEVVAPASGTIVGINAEAERSPEKITADPYGDGWLMVIRLADPAALSALLTAEEYERLAEEA